MSKAKVTVKFEITSNIEGFMSDDVAREIGSGVDEEVRSLISAGESPVRGERRFDPYKNPEKYPGKLKPKNPVNLELTGEMLGWLRFERSGNTVNYGFLSGTPSAVMTRALAHNEGTAVLPVRQMIPGDGQEWAVSIVRRLKDVYSRRLADIIKKSND